LTESDAPKPALPEPPSRRPLPKGSPQPGSQGPYSGATNPNPKAASEIADDEPLIFPLRPDQWDAEMYKTFSVFIGEPAEKLPEAGSGRRLDPLNFPMVGLMMQSQPAAQAWWRFNRYLLFDTTFSPRLRELAILRISKHYQSHYEWHEHVKLGKFAGLTEEEILRVAAGNDGFEGDELLVLQATDQLLSDRHRIERELWLELVEKWGMAMAHEVLYLVGAYQVLSQNFLTWQLQPPPDSPPIP
jgi:alkylhydroperoxidase family enzyme